MSTRVNSRCGLFIGIFLSPRFELSKNWQNAHPVAMRNLAPQHRVLELERELGGGAYATVRGECAAKQQGAVAETGAGMFLHQRARMHHRGHGTFLIERR